MSTKQQDATQRERLVAAAIAFRIDDTSSHWALRNELMATHYDEIASVLAEYARLRDDVAAAYKRGQIDGAQGQVNFERETDR